LLFVLFCVLFVCKCALPPGDNTTAVNTIYQYKNTRLLKTNAFRNSLHHSRKTHFNIVDPLTTTNPKWSLHIFRPNFNARFLPSCWCFLGHTKVRTTKYLTVCRTAPLGLEQNVVKSLYPPDDNSLHVGVCCKSLCQPCAS